ncbi:MAG: DinB family protein [Gemmatales bacterium]
MAKALSITAVLLDQLESVFHGKAWHGPTLRDSLRGLTAQDAGESLTRSGHSIADIALHCAYWKYSVHRRLQNSKRGSFPWKGSNWFKLPKPLPEPEWNKILKTLDEEHQALRLAVEAFHESRLGRIPLGSKYSYYQLIQGIAAHDVFHAGQVRLLKRPR